jgi:hypothetical protein
MSAKALWQFFGLPWPPTYRYLLKTICMRSPSQVAPFPTKKSVRYEGEMMHPMPPDQRHDFNQIPEPDTMRRDEMCRCVEKGGRERIYIQRDVMARPLKKKAAFDEFGYWFALDRLWRTLFEH